MFPVASFRCNSFNFILNLLILSVDCLLDFLEASSELSLSAILISLPNQSANHIFIKDQHVLRKQSESRLNNLTLSLMSS